MIRLLQDIKLLFHEVDQYLMLANVLLVYNFYGACDTSLGVKALSYLSERAFPEDTSNLILGRDVICALKRLEQSELQYFLSRCRPDFRKWVLSR